MMSRLFSFLLLFPLLAALSATAAAQTDYVIRGVEVKATASDGTTARMQAMEEGEKQAFARLLEQMLPPEQAAARAEAVPAHQISRMVRGYEVHDEKVSGTGYAARLDISFDPAQVQALLRPAAPAAPAAPAGVLTPPAPVRPVPAPPVAAPPVAAPAAFPRMAANMLVLPVWAENAEKPLLWEPHNAWRTAWNKAERSDTQFIRLPIGDQSDRMMVDAMQAMEDAYQSFGPIAERYQSSTVVVAVAAPTVSSGVNALSVRLRNLAQGQLSSELPLVYEQAEGESMQDVMARAAQDIIRQLMQQAQQRAAREAQAAATAAAGTQPTQQIHGPRSRLTVLSRLDRLNDWVALRKRLLTLPGVEQVDLAAISSHQVDMVVHFRGSPMQLESSMTAQGMRVEKGNNYWVVGF